MNFAPKNFSDKIAIQVNDNFDYDRYNAAAG